MVNSHFYECVMSKLRLEMVRGGGGECHEQGGRRRQYLFLA